MPVMNGWDFLEAIQSSTFANRVSVIMTTSSIDIEDRIKAKHFPLVIDFLVKPLSVEILAEVNKDLLLKLRLLSSPQG
jgi:response regulator RpfG family c-di-GMP phosphodiesterase